VKSRAKVWVDMVAGYNAPLNARKARLSSRSVFLRVAGFSLLELMVSIVVLLVIAGSTLYAVNYYQQSYTRTENVSDMFENVRGVAEL